MPCQYTTPSLLPDKMKNQHPLRERRFPSDHQAVPADLRSDTGGSESHQSQVKVRQTALANAPPRDKKDQMSKFFTCSNKNMPVTQVREKQ